ncbi:RNA polymerase subunit sigma-24, partial [Stenotrophomonas maltophilia]
MALVRAGRACCDRRMLDPALTQRLETLWRMESPVLIARLARLLGGDVGRAE